MRLPEVTQIINGQLRVIVPSIHDLAAGTELSHHAYATAFVLTTGAFVVVSPQIDSDKKTAKLEVRAQFAGQYVIAFMEIDLFETNEEKFDGMLQAARLTYGYLITTVADLVAYRAICLVDGYRKEVQRVLTKGGWIISPTGEATPPGAAPASEPLKN